MNYSSCSSDTRKIGRDSELDNLDNETIVRQLQQGTGDRNELLEMLWNQNLRLVRKIIHESTGLDHWKDQDFEDLEQQAFLGILESVSRFDFDQGNRFFTYATHYIIKSIRKYYDRYGQSLRIPPDMRAKVKRYMNARQELSASGQYPSDSVLREYLEMSDQEFRNVSDTARKLKLTSLDGYIQDGDKDSGTVLDMVSAPAQNTEIASDSVYLQELHKTLTAALDTLPKIECEIIYGKFYQEQTLAQIADILGCSRQNVSQHLKESYRKLRRGKYGKELASFLPDKAKNRVIKKREREFEGLSDSEKDLLL